MCVCFGTIVNDVISNLSEKSTELTFTELY